MRPAALHALRVFALLTLCVAGCCGFFARISIAQVSAVESRAAGRLAGSGLRLSGYEETLWSTGGAANASDTSAVVRAAILAAAASLGGMIAGAIAVVVTRGRLIASRNAVAWADLRFERLAEQTSDMVLLVENGRACLARDTLLGNNIGATVPLSELVHPLDLAELDAAIVAADDMTSPRHLTCRLVHRDGQTLWAEAGVCRLTGPDRATETIVAFRDVTRAHAESERLSQALDQAREAQLRADAASRAKGDFLSSMSHEIRTPLNAIIGFADVLLAAPDLTDTGRRSAERIKVGGDALLTILNDVLDYSQLDAGALRLNARPFVLPLLVDECISLVERLAIAKSLALRVDLVDRFPAGVLGDDARLRQVLLNLVNNAIKFTQHGTVTVRIRFDRGSGPDRVVFEVIDTGIGIAPEDLPSLFQRFRQVDGTVRRAYGGTGLGLAISKMLVETMGGEIGVTSEKGLGSTFWFALDLPAVSLVIEAQQRPAPVVAVRRMTILLAEDIKLNQELARAILEARGHHVDVVDDGAEAIMAVQDRSYDLVLMDVQMPVVDGLTATRAIRVLKGQSRFVPIVAMTANVMRDQVEAARGAGMDDILAKPLSLDTVDALLKRAADDAVRTAPDPGALEPATLAQLRLAVGDARTETMLSTLAANLSGRFTRTFEADALLALQADAKASLAVAAMLGFRRFADICGRFAASDAASAGEYDALIRELGLVVRTIGALRARSDDDAKARSAA